MLAACGLNDRKNIAFVCRIWYNTVIGKQPYLFSGYCQKIAGGIENNRKGLSGMSSVISIASISGGGKTTIVNALMNRLNNAAALCFDDYDFDEHIEYVSWLKNGADYNEWDLTPLKNDIDKLMGQTEYILLDYPFSYKNKSIAPYIDISVYIDTPLDVALVRRILRDMPYAPGDQIREYILDYIKYERPLYQLMIDNIMPDSDIVVDGLLPVNDIADKIIQAGGWR